MLVSLQILELHRKNTSSEENTLPLNTEKPKSSSTQLDTSPSTLESKHLGCASAAQLYIMVQNISSAIIDLSTNVKLLLAKFSEREHPHQFDCGLSIQQFPLSSEEELQMLDTGLQQKETRDRFMAMVTRSMDNDHKTSMRYVLWYLMTPEVASSFTLPGASSKRALQKCRFYGCIRNIGFPNDSQIFDGNPYRTEKNMLNETNHGRKSDADFFQMIHSSPMMFLINLMKIFHMYQILIISHQMSFVLAV
ncbi:unnamed protein product [Schistosoma mattheei]|uniref:Uncharacterized protein n=1 Tax=Schistosoma mattheei TaxID=31246 RepID=A0A183NV81_9TREM|nr:unnamed protein product [Schistosoma mattheei]